MKKKNIFYIFFLVLLIQKLKAVEIPYIIDSQYQEIIKLNQQTSEKIKNFLNRKNSSHFLEFLNMPIRQFHELDQFVISPKDKELNVILDNHFLDLQIILNDLAFPYKKETVFPPIFRVRLLETTFHDSFLETPIKTSPTLEDKIQEFLEDINYYFLMYWKATVFEDEQE